MAKTHNLGFPRIGARRELKFATDRYFKGETSEQELLRVAAEIRRSAWESQSQLDSVPVGDHSLYDHVLDMSFLLGHVPQRVQGRSLEDYFRVARGRGPSDPPGGGVAAAEMTKWFDTNYHFIVPEFESKTSFELSPGRLLAQISEAIGHGHRPKVVLVGPVTYLWLGKEKDKGARLDLLPALLAAYQKLLSLLAEAGVEWVQLDEPILATELPQAWQKAIEKAYDALSYGGPRVLLATYFGPLGSNLDLATALPVHGLHIDGVGGHDHQVSARESVAQVHARLSETKVLSVGVVCGRNIWKTDLDRALDLLEPLEHARGERLWVAPSCSLLHVPVDLEQEENLDPEVKPWLSFAAQKLEEVKILAHALEHGRDSTRGELRAHRGALEARRSSERVTQPSVQKNVAALDERAACRSSHYSLRRKLQEQALKLPQLPTTTIGSFPQTTEIRRARQDLRTNKISEATYERLMKNEIEGAVRHQERLGLDVLVHGEAERNDMVEYFGEQLDGFVISEYGWVQSYGSRCVKPPILFGDVSRRGPMTVKWTEYAQSLTARPMKGMLTGPVTILNWSYVRDDQPRAATCLQLALALRGEVLDLESAGVKIIQIDEAALREGLPLRKSEWPEYLKWAVTCFRTASGAVRDETQIHTHMCYSEFNDIIESIAALDADVITIETSRSDMELLDAFDSFDYPNEIGPGVYDIHSPNVPSEEQIVHLMKRAMEKIPADRLWINPDCGLKTRDYREVLPALNNMMRAAMTLRCELNRAAKTS